MTKTGWALALVSLGIVIAALILFILPGKTNAPTTGTDQPATTTPAGNLVAQIPNTIVVSAPYINGEVSSPLTITGSARAWYFEASFPIEIRNASGTIIGQGPAQAQGDWMTSDFVPFVATLSFPAQPAGSPGTIILRKDNPSGLPQNDESLSLPVVFQ
ncbi:MAG: hypothetical protein JWL87_702 [Candidatus Adlerbacteria bacterium]|nr:hypothetical protein [Candidatus Adlerbacteria bacterium]